MPLRKEDSTNKTHSIIWAQIPGIPFVSVQELWSHLAHATSVCSLLLLAIKWKVITDSSVTSLCVVICAEFLILGNMPSLPKQWSDNFSRLSNKVGHVFQASVLFTGRNRGHTIWDCWEANRGLILILLKNTWNSLESWHYAHDVCAAVPSLVSVFRAERVTWDTHQTIFILMNVLRK